MKEALTVLVRDDGVAICHPTASNADELIPADADLGEQARRFCARHGLTVDTLVFFVSEAQLFFKNFELPAKTVDLQEAIGYQLGLLTPFDPQEVFFSYAAVREKDVQVITLYALAKKAVEPLLQSAGRAGFQIAGLYPDYQRYVGRGQLPTRWGLLLPGVLPKAFLFKGPRLQTRLICQPDPTFAALQAALETETIYFAGRPEDPAATGFQPLAPMEFGKLALKELNLLPSSYRRPEYSRRLVAGLAVLNVAALLLMAGVLEYRVWSLDRELTAQVEALKPQVREVQQLAEQEKTMDKYLTDFNQNAQNPDILGILKKLTEGLPHSAYLDQIRMEKNSRAVTIRGYSNDISEMSAQLQNLGEAKLRSTSRRRDKTYFDVEIGMP